jgi:SAM-dependent methyltransferase
MTDRPLAGESAFAGSLVGHYDSVLGPFMFEPFARETARRLAGVRGPVLEVCAGTGALTRELDRILPPDATIVATDLNPPMLDQAAARLTSPRVTWRQADALALPFEDGAFDAVACQFGVMFYPDPVAGHREARRVLKPGGLYVLAVWDDLESNPVAEAVHQAVAACFPQDPPQFFARTPHGHHDIAKLREALAAGGFADAAVDTVTLEAGRFTADELAAGFCQGTPLRHEIEQRAAAGLGGTTGAVAEALRERFRAEKIASKIQAHVIAAGREANG